LRLKSDEKMEVLDSVVVVVVGVTLGRPRAGDVCLGSCRFALRWRCGVAGSDAPLKMPKKSQKLENTS
jgi:hypothetical protein